MVEYYNTASNMAICDCVDILDDDNDNNILDVYRSKRERRVTGRSRKKQNQRAIARLRRQILLTNIQIFKEVVKLHVVRTHAWKQKLEDLREKKLELVEQLVSKREMLSCLHNSIDM